MKTPASSETAYAEVSIVSDGRKMQAVSYSRLQYEMKSVLDRLALL